jgi:drug/metabolite transporter (DMT)-like permease
MDKPLQGAYKALPHVALIFAQLSFSGWHILGQMAFRGGAHPVVVALYREILSTVLMFGCVYYMNRSRGLRGCVRMISEVFNGEDKRQFLLIGVTSFINMIASILGLHFTNAALFALFQPIVPVVATILSIVQGYEGYSHLKIVGICLGIAGALIVETAGHSSSSNTTDKAGKEREEDGDMVYYIGLCFIFAQVVACATFLTMQKGIASKYDSITITFIYYLVATTMTVLLAALMGLLGYLDGDDMTFSGNDVYTGKHSSLLLLVNLFHL